MARVLENSNLSREDVLRRIELQWSDEEKVNLADFTLRNYGTEKELKAQIQKVYAELA
jgi:dephospho-CoA kinase